MGSKEYNKQYQHNHLVECATYHRRYTNTLKSLALWYYGGGQAKCVTCGEDRFDCLSIDHINDDGYKQGSIGLCGATLYRWLRRNNYPEGYQTLCMNCQFIKKAKVAQEKAMVRQGIHKPVIRQPMCFELVEAVVPELDGEGRIKS